MTLHPFIDPSAGWRVWIVGISEDAALCFKNLPELPELKRPFLEAVRRHFDFHTDEQAERAAVNLELRLAVCAPSAEVISYYTYEDLHSRKRNAC